MNGVQGLDYSCQNNYKNMENSNEFKMTCLNCTNDKNNNPKNLAPCDCAKDEQQIIFYPIPYVFNMLFDTMSDKCI